MRHEGRRWKPSFIEYLLFARYCSVLRVLQIFKCIIFRQYNKEGTLSCILQMRKPTLITLMKIIQLVTNRTQIRTYLSRFPYPHSFSTPVPPWHQQLPTPSLPVSPKSSPASSTCRSYFNFRSLYSSQPIFKELTVDIFELWWILNDFLDQVPYFFSLQNLN